MKQRPSDKSLKEGLKNKIKNPYSKKTSVKIALKVDKEELHKYKGQVKMNMDQDECKPGYNGDDNGNRGTYKNKRKGDSYNDEEVMEEERYFTIPSKQDNSFWQDLYKYIA